MASMDFDSKHRRRVRWRDPGGQARTKNVETKDEGRRLIKTIEFHQKLFPNRPFDRELDSPVLGEWTLGQIQLLFGTLAEKYDGSSPEQILTKLKEA